MKKVILLIVTAGTMFYSYAQRTTPVTNESGYTGQDYLQKSKKQRTGAIVMISAGGALAIAGIAVSANDLNNDVNGIFDPTVKTNHHETLATVLAVTGFAAMLGSIGLFIAAHKNKKRAMALSFKNELVPQFQRSMALYKSVPSLSLRIPL